MGIDEAGKQFSDEVIHIIDKTKCLTKISFLARSLGGLFARNAIAVFYSSNTCNGDQPNDNSVIQNSPRTKILTGRMVADLEPINIISLPSPHLGVRGKMQQLPFLLGVPILKKLCPSLAPLLVGQIGSHLFLTDGKPNKPPLLFRVAFDCEDGKFISAPGALDVAWFMLMYHLIIWLGGAFPQ